MEKIILKAEKRFAVDKAKDLRNAKKLPWVVYGHKMESTPIVVEYSDFLRTFRKAWESQIISLELDSKKIEVLVHEVQKEPVTWFFTHFDLYAITRWEKLTTNVSLDFVWVSEAAKQGAIVEELTKEIEIKCLPKDLLENIEVDLSLLKDFDDVIKISDLNIDTSKYEVVSPMDTVIAIAAKPKKVTEEETTTEETTEEQAEEK